MAITLRDLGLTVRRAGYIPEREYQAGTGEVIVIRRFSFICGHRDELVLNPGWFNDTHAVKVMLARELDRDCLDCRYSDFIAAWKSGS